MKGLYIHVPFCPKKCPYCDFYSLNYTAEKASKFTQETLRRIALIDETFDTVYFGGGTPSLLGNEKINSIISAVKLSANAEITLETNPNINFNNWKGTKINRLSIGLQSVNEKELKFLGRNHNSEKAKKCIESARNIGINNISLDLMIALPDMTKESLLNSINFCEEQNVTHVSSYILKVEENTPFYNQNIAIPDDEISSDMYLFMVDELSKRGYTQYEISNFSKPNFESRHNLKYWNLDEYYAFGPSAHAYLDSKRLYFPRDLEYYLNGNEPILDCDGGDFEEFLMLKLRLSKGITREDCDKFSTDLFDKVEKNTKKIPAQYLNCTGNKISLTAKGFLLSNAIIVTLLDI